MRILRFASTLICGLWIAASSPAADVTSQAGAPPAAGTGVIAGQVVDAIGRAPIGGAVVTLSLASATPALGAPAPPAAAARRGVAVANGDGRFVFRDLPAGSYSLSSSLAGYVAGAFGRRRPNGPTRPIVLTDGARITDAVIPMWRLGVITGTVRDDRGEPVVGAYVRGMRRTLTNGRFKLGYDGGGGESTDDRGQFRISNLAPGSYAITVSTAMQSAAVTTVDAYRAAVTAGTTAEIRRNWSQSGAVQIEREGVLVDDWQVSVSHGGIPPLPGPNGTLFVHPAAFYAAATTPAEATLITLDSGDTRTGVDLILSLAQGVRVAGVLAGPEGPAAGHGLRLRSAAAGEVTYDNPVAYCMSDAAGRFAFHGITPGSYTIEAYRITQRAGPYPPAPPAAGGLPVGRAEVLGTSSGPPLFADARIAVGSSHIDGLALSLQPGARISGRVVFDGASPPPAARIAQVTLGVRSLLEYDAVRGIDARVDVEGRFTTPGHAPGRYTFLVTPPGPEWTLASVRIGSDDAAAQAFTLGTSDISEVVVTFTDRVTTLSGTVRAEPAGDPESTVIVYPADVDAWIASGMSPRRVVVAPVSQTGAYDLRLQVPGDYMAVAIPPEITPEVDREFVRRFGTAAVRVSFALGDRKTQPLVVRAQR